MVLEFVPMGALVLPVHLLIVLPVAIRAIDKILRLYKKIKKVMV
jgi:hypothetical protein